MKLSIVIPAHNEVESVGETVQRTVDELTRAAIDQEVLVIDDASSDGTGELVRELWDHPSRPSWEPGGGGLGLHTILTHRDRPGRIIVAIRHLARD